MDVGGKELRRRHQSKGEHMTDVEINKALALAIGWKGSDLILNHKCFLYCFEGQEFVGVFDHKDWNVIGPIAQKYDLFPHLNSSGTWTVWTVWAKERWHTAHTPQKAIALALIERTKK